MKVDLPGCTVERHADHILTTFDDGTTSANWPHPDDPFDGGYVQVARDCGFGPDRLMDYCFEHEICHQLVPLRLFGHHGYVSKMAAQGRKMSLAAAMAEERLVYYIQRFVNDPTYPCPDPQWVPIRDELLALRNVI